MAGSDCWRWSVDGRIATAGAESGGGGGVRTARSSNAERLSTSLSEAREGVTSVPSTEPATRPYPSRLPKPSPSPDPDATPEPDADPEADDEEDDAEEDRRDRGGPAVGDDLE